MFKGPDMPSPVHEEEGRISSHEEPREEVKKTKIAKVEVYLTCQRGTRRLFAAGRQVFNPQLMEGALPLSPFHRKMFASQGVEGALPSSSTKYIQVE